MNTDFNALQIEELENKLREFYETFNTTLTRTDYLKRCNEYFDKNKPTPKVEPGQRVPWKMLLQESDERVRNSRESDGRFPKELSMNGTLDHFKIPCEAFSGNEENHKQWGFPLLPPEIARQCRFGKVVTYLKRRYVVVQINGTPKGKFAEFFEIHLTPIEYIDGVE